MVLIAGVVPRGYLWGCQNFLGVLFIPHFVFEGLQSVFILGKIGPHLFLRWSIGSVGWKWDTAALFLRRLIRAISWERHTAALFLQG